MSRSDLKGQGPGVCKDCTTEGVATRRPAPHPGPRCATHHRAVRKTRKTAARDRRVVNVYGLKPGDWQKLLDACDGKCMGCRKWKAKACDHDHKCCNAPTSCGKCVRGALCGRCNSLLAKVADSVDILLNLAEYLRNPPARRILGLPPLENGAL